ncbi:transcription factor Adf-1-like isoform X2 [Anopheles stephensi]|uniref:transcription factor Adf-1-like isoform X2 n=1 Tax=Anopheles stephensi TaxID=30069 RepID=UPI0016588188|nr:transcription factor Adf-1-like isoform X2 [Anopheles stephensi]
MIVSWHKDLADYNSCRTNLCYKQSGFNNNQVACIASYHHGRCIEQTAHNKAGSCSCASTPKKQEPREEDVFREQFDVSGSFDEPSSPNCTVDDPFAETIETGNHFEDTVFTIEEVGVETEDIAKYESDEIEDDGDIVGLRTNMRKTSNEVESGNSLSIPNGPHRLLIQLIKHHPVIWSATTQRGTNCSRRADAWRTISNIMGKPEEMVRKKWLSLCAYFRKERRKVRCSMIAAAAPSNVYVSNWFAFDSMQFLRRAIRMRSLRPTSKVARIKATANHRSTKALTGYKTPPTEQQSVFKQSQTATTNGAHVKLQPSTSRTERTVPDDGYDADAMLKVKTTNKKEPNRDDRFDEIFTSIGQSLEAIITNLNSSNSRNVAMGNLVTQTLDGLPDAEQEELIMLINEAIYKVKTGRVRYMGRTDCI